MSATWSVGTGTITTILISGPALDRLRSLTVAAVSHRDPVEVAADARALAVLVANMAEIPVPGVRRRPGVVIPGVRTERHGTR